MRITDLIWLDDVVEKLELKHRVTIAEVEQVFASRLKVKRMRKGHFRGEHVYRGLGRTITGRYLTIFFIYKQTGESLILSARDMDEKERKSYARK